MNLYLVSGYIYIFAKGKDKIYDKQVPNYFKHYVVANDKATAVKKFKEKMEKYDIFEVEILIIECSESIIGGV